MNGNTRLALSCGLTLETAWSRSALVSAWKSRRDEKPAPPLGLPTVFCIGR
jgi:16S rRNA (cytidine1402-2'-O)-methyltransferase